MSSVISLIQRTRIGNLIGTSTRTQVGRRVSNEAVQERQNRDRILPNPHRHGSTNLVLNEGTSMILKTHKIL